MMEYKGYVGHVTFDDEANILHGDVINTRDVITFQGKSVSEIRQAFKDSIDEYLQWCEERGKAPDKPFSGNLILRISPELHRSIFLSAKREGKSLNKWIEEHLASSLSSKQGRTEKGVFGPAPAISEVLFSWHAPSECFSHFREDNPTKFGYFSGKHSSKVRFK